MECPSCHAEIRDDAAFCPSCGAKVEACVETGAQSSTPAPAVSSPAQTQVSAAPVKSVSVKLPPKKVLIPAVAAVVALIAGFMIFTNIRDAQEKTDFVKRALTETIGTNISSYAQFDAEDESTVTISDISVSSDVAQTGGAHTVHARAKASSDSYEVDFETDIVAYKSGGYVGSWGQPTSCFITSRTVRPLKGCPAELSISKSFNDGELTMNEPTLEEKNGTFTSVVSGVLTRKGWYGTLTATVSKEYQFGKEGWKSDKKAEFSNTSMTWDLAGKSFKTIGTSPTDDQFAVVFQAMEGDQVVIDYAFNRTDSFDAVSLSGNVKAKPILSADDSSPFVIEVTDPATNMRFVLSENSQKSSETGVLQARMRAELQIPAKWFKTPSLTLVNIT